ncbi:MAG: DUF3574 domain-containing protein [Azospirillum sp.]|nr:DUF3574 domain-containing protein [Azospirillum sp.]
MAKMLFSTAGTPVGSSGRALAIGLLWLFYLSGCSALTPPERADPSELRCLDGTARGIVTSLYFGLSRTGRPDISDRQWQSFVETEILPRFPGGFTIVDARGYWQGRSGATESERTKVFVLGRSGDAAEAAALAQIIAAYLWLFDQQAVGRTEQVACLGF